MTVQLVQRPSKHHGVWRILALFFAAFAIAAMLFIWAAVLHVPGTATPPATAALAPYTIKQAKPRIRYWWSPSRLTNCVRFNNRPFKPVRCKGFNTWIAPGRTIYVGIFRDGAGNEYPTWGEL
jgi:hypothetical protein